MVRSFRCCFGFVPFSSFLSAKCFWLCPSLLSVSYDIRFSLASGDVYISSWCVIPFSFDLGITLILCQFVVLPPVAPVLLNFMFRCLSNFIPLCVAFFLLIMFISDLVSIIKSLSGLEKQNAQGVP